MASEHADGEAWSGDSLLDAPLARAFTEPPVIWVEGRAVGGSDKTTALLALSRRHQHLRDDLDAMTARAELAEARLEHIADVLRDLPLGWASEELVIAIQDCLERTSDGQ